MRFGATVAASTRQHLRKRYLTNYLSSFIVFDRAVFLACISMFCKNNEHVHCFDRLPNVNCGSKIKSECRNEAEGDGAKSVQNNKKTNSEHTRIGVQ